MATTLPSQDAWTRARNRYMEDLTQEEKQSYLQATPEKIFYDASAAEKRHEASSTSRRSMHKLQPFIAAIEQYGQAIDVYSNAYPLVLSPLWGSIRVLLMIAREFGKYFEKLVDMFARIGDVLPRFQVYEKLFPDHQCLIHALSVAYVDVIVFCSDAKAVFRRGQRPSLTSLKVGFKLMWKPFESQFSQQLDNFRNHLKNVEKEAGLSHMVEAADARALALANHLQLERAKQENERRRILAMIESSDVEAKHRKLQNLRFHGTGEWVVQNEKYLEWKHAISSSSLCCSGIPGSGKSVLASRIIDDLANSFHSTTVYYYCDYADQRTLQTGRILGTILKQLLRVNASPKEFEAQILRSYEDGQRTPGTHEMMDLVCSLMQLHPLVYIVLDGLDECERESRQDILNFFKRLTTYEKVSVRTLVCCRDEDQLLRSLSSDHRIQLTTTALGSDIESFVRGSVRYRIESGQLTVRDPDLEQEIVRELVSKAHEMFLWIYFQLDDLCEALSDAIVRQTLQELPVGLAQTYERILLKISKSPSHKQVVALRALRWTICSRRPMKIEELQEAVAFGSLDTTWDRDKLPEENLMIETCRGLLVRDEADRTVRFAHHTVQQYLLSPLFIKNEGEAHSFVSSRSEAEATVGELCLTYLCFSDFETQITLRTPTVNLEALGVLKLGGPATIPSVLGIAKSLLEIPYRLLNRKPTSSALEIDYSKYLTPTRQAQPQVPSELSEKYQLLNYIVEYWMDHTKDLKPFSHAQLRYLAMHKTLSFELRPWGPNQHFGPYGCVSCSHHSDPTKAKDLPYMSLFHYAARIGHWSLMESLAEEYCGHEQPSDDTLMIACRHGQKLIVEKLMSIAYDDIVDGRAVSIAVAAGHADILQYFIDLSQEPAKSSKQSYDIRGDASSLLEIAATNGHENVVNTIIAWRHPNPNAFPDLLHINKINPRTGRTVFFSAVMSGNENIVRRLLSRCPMIKVEQNTAFHIAAEYGHARMLEILFEFVGNNRINTGYGMIKNTGHGNGTNGTYTEFLLRFFDSEGEAPLHKAARKGHYDAVKIILEHQVPVDSTTEYRTNNFEDMNMLNTKTSFTALHLAVRGGHLELVKFLIDSGADIEAKSSNVGWTPLHLAAGGGHEIIVACLLELSAGRYARVGDRWGTSASALHFAVYRGHGTVVRTLLNDDFRKPAISTEMLGLIAGAAENGHEDVVRALLDWVGMFEEGYLEEMLQVARRFEIPHAPRLLEDLSLRRFGERNQKT